MVRAGAIALIDRRQVVLATAMRLTGHLIAEGTGDHLDAREIAREVADGGGEILSSLHLFASDHQWRLVTLSKKAYEMSALVIETNGEHTKEIDGLLKWLRDEQKAAVERLSEIQGQVPSLVR